MIVWILVILAIILIYKWGTSTFDYFEKKGVPYNKPFFLIGSRSGMFWKQGSIVDFLSSLYNEFKDEK